MNTNTSVNADKTNNLVTAILKSASDLLKQAYQCSPDHKMIAMALTYAAGTIVGACEDEKSIKETALPALISVLGVGIASTSIDYPVTQPNNSTTCH